MSQDQPDKIYIKTIMESPLVSIIVFAYNSSQFIIETLNSALNQTYNNLELIITDDGSTDATIEICTQWLENHKSRFKRAELLTTPKNTGLPGNCNRGWMAANGIWMKYIAGDDYLLPNCIKSYINYIHSHPESRIIFANALLIDEFSNPLQNQNEFYKNEIKGWRSYFFDQSAKHQLKLFAREPIFLVTPSLFIKKELLQQIEGFDLSLRIFEDIPLVFKCLIHGDKIYNIVDQTVAYRIHSQAISRKKDKAKEERMLKEYSYIYSTYRRPNLKAFNIFDVSVRFQAWLHFKYALKYHLKGARFFSFLNVFHWYQKHLAFVQSSSDK